MHVTSLLLLHALIWHTSTVVALVAARPSHLQTRAEPTPEYPKGHDAKTCPLDSTPMITLDTSSSDAEASLARAGAAVVPADSPSSPTTTQRRDLTADQLRQICRQVGHFPFTRAGFGGSPGAYHSVATVKLMKTSTVQPGLYVAILKANSLIRGLSVADAHAPWAHYAEVSDNRSDRIGVRFQVERPTRLRIGVTFWWTAPLGAVDLFSLGPRGWVGPYPTIAGDF
ncbi:hypothetical protein MMC16_005534 [Acarospora aff. strigata]|nr:hypothetical protein [Acarospora aff. strigata]